MALRAISDIRRQELRAAAFRVMQRAGVPGTTLERVAAEAGASKGIVLHYFGSKDALFEQVMREANLVLAQRVAARLAAAATPMDRLLAVIRGNFDADLFTAPICQAWLSLVAEVPRNPPLARVQRVIHARMRSNLLSALSPALPRDRAEAEALRLAALIDGLWLREGLAPGGLSPDAAMALVESTLPAL
jgi:TetR/AcrR family transcriptional repressor of bet genes